MLSLYNVLVQIESVRINEADKVGRYLTIKWQIVGQPYTDSILELTGPTAIEAGALDPILRALGIRSWNAEDLDSLVGLLQAAGSSGIVIMADLDEDARHYPRLRNHRHLPAHLRRSGS